jgi:hypothetical protein
VVPSPPPVRSSSQWGLLARLLTPPRAKLSSASASDSCQITPTNPDQPCLDAEARMACPLAFDELRSTDELEA